MDRIPPTPLRFTPTAAGPRGVKAAETLRISPRDLANKNQGWVQVGCRLAWVSSVVSFLLFLNVKKGYQGEGSRLGGEDSASSLLGGKKA